VLAPIRPDTFPQIVYCVWLCFETVFCYLFIIETKGRSLEETAALFDGEEAEAAIAGHHAGATEVREDYEKQGAFTPEV
jgi:hypothetical protein